MTQDIWVMQDGADFYIYDEDPNNAADFGECLSPSRRERAPFRVSDGDLKGAMRARSWFEENGYFKGGQVLHWVS